MARKTKKKTAKKSPKKRAKALRRPVARKAAKPAARKAAPAKIIGTEHWTTKQDKGESVKLYLFNKVMGDPKKARGVVLLVHGSSMASTPTFDLQVPGRSDSSVMDVLARAGYDVWCVDMEGYGKSEKGRDNNALISQGADDCLAAATYICKLRGPKKLLTYGISSGALRAALFAQRNPEIGRAHV